MLLCIYFYLTMIFTVFSKLDLTCDENGCWFYQIKELPLYPNSSYEDYLESWTGDVCGRQRFCSDVKRGFYQTCGKNQYIECAKCRCDVDCLVIGDCCIDMLMEHNFTRHKLADYVTCAALPSKLLGGGTPGTGDMVYMIDSCPDNMEGDDFARQCVSMKHHEDILTPVIDPETYVVYRNVYCAQCHGITEVIKWNLFTGCQWSRNMKHAMRNVKSVVEYVMSSDRCEIALEPPDGYKRQQCRTPPSDVISTCNKTGNWQTYDNYTERGCLGFVSLTEHLISSSDAPDEFEYYGNIFCAKCNGVDLDGDDSAGTCDHQGIVNTKLMPFSVLFNFNPEPITDTATLDGIVECPYDQVYNSYKKECVQIHCSDARDIINHTCVPSFKSAHGIPYIMDLYMQPHPNTTVTDVSSGDVKKYISEWFTRKESTYWQANATVYRLLVTRKILGVHVRFFNIHESFTTKQTELEEKLINFVMSEWVLNQHGSPMLFPTNAQFFQSSHDHQTTKFEVLGGRDIDTEVPIDEYIQGNYLMTCPQVHYKPDEYTLNHVNKTVMINMTDEMFSEFEFIIDIDNGTLIVCSTFNSTFRIPVNTSSTPDWQSIVTVVCCTISISLLLLTVIIYTTVPIPHQIPWQNNMSLITNLLLAQSMFVLGIKQTTDTSICPIIGALIHYFWLAVFCWKSVCAYHMYQVFTRPQEIVGTYRKYLIYAQLVPVVIITIASTVHLYTTNWSDSGYGGTICFLNSPLMIGVTFALPVGVIILVNAILFTLVIRSISKLSEYQLSSNQSNRNYTILYIKLSVVLGFPWVVGFVAAGTRNDVLWVIFTILNATPGLWIFVAFVCTKSMMAKCRERYCCVVGDKSRSTVSSNTQTQNQQ